jgi:hypothetical protein
MDVIQRWTEKANQVMRGHTIVNVRYLTDQEQEAFGWRSKSVVIQLDDDTLIFPSMDDEGNNAGALHYIKDGDDDNCIPIIY